ncbi:hypothetical protein ACET3X_001346 [Alternaria dauci]|uniref:Uncharacterized protein n=1 Tax=Alternaria dauci TaxID=48095 RepID=A0ABR3UZB5_9PLEO
MERNKKLKLTVWPKYDWWTGGPLVFIDERGNAQINPGGAAKPNAVSVAISRMLHISPISNNSKAPIVFWGASLLKPFYVQQEIRQSGNTWNVDRKGDMFAPTMAPFCGTGDEDDMKFVQSLAVYESFVRTN